MAASIGGFSWTPGYAETYSLGNIAKLDEQSSLLTYRVFWHGVTELHRRVSYLGLEGCSALWAMIWSSSDRSNDRNKG